ncbi:hypothetical protein Tco_1411677, partial [Tanacetum coccineum]
VNKVQVMDTLAGRQLKSHYHNDLHGIPLVNAGEIPDVDPYEEVVQQWQTHPLSLAYVPDPIELDEHVPLYVPEYPKLHDSSEEDMPVEDQSNAEDANSRGTDDEDPKEDPKEDPSEEHESEDEQDSDEAEPFEEDETAATPPSPGRREARVFVRPQPPMAASTQAPIDACATRSPSVPLPPTSPTYDRAPLAESSAAATARAPRGQYVFVDTFEAGQGLIHSPGHDAQTIAKVADRAEDVGYVRALQASEHRMMTSIEEVNLRRIRLEIDVVRGQRTAYETELYEVRQAYLSFEARNRALLAQLETLETHMSRMEWQRQRAEDDAVRQIMHTQVLEARAQIDTVEDAGSSC